MSLYLKGRNLISMNDLSREEIRSLMKTTEMLKIQRRTGAPHDLLKGKVLAMIFEKPSTRTRVSFESGMIQLGGSAIYLSSSDLQLKRGETVSDTSRVLSRYVDIIMARVFAHQTVAELGQYSSVPVINGLSDDEHPCQILGDLFTIWEKKERFEGLKLAYIGDGNNMCNSLMIGAAKVGIHVHTAHPEGYFPREKFVTLAREIARENKCEVTVGSDPIAAAKDADVLYTDVWVSMGQEKSGEEKKAIFKNYQISRELLSHSRKDAIVMHCLPAHRGEEITDEVMEGPQSVVFDEAENRLHAQKAVMASLI
jgi:ornithine carbamoyltransferase